MLSGNFKGVSVSAVLGLTLSVMAESIVAAPLVNKECFPAIDGKQPQYLVGYGTLLQEAGRDRKLKQPEFELPVWVHGYERGWFARIKAKAPYRTVLGTVKQSDKSLNGLLISSSRSQLEGIDRSDAIFCRMKLEKNQISSMIAQKLPEKGQFWMYVVKKDHKFRPASKFPVMQSDIDVFLTGCLELSKDFELPDYASECIQNTSDWSQHWNYDRRIPSGGKLVRSKRVEIDNLLETLQGHLYDKVRAE